MKAEISSETLVNRSQSTSLYFHKIVLFRVTALRTSEFTVRLSVHERRDYETANLIHMYLGHKRAGELKTEYYKISTPQQQVFATAFLA